MAIFLGKDGKIDYSTLGNILVAKLLEEVDLMHIINNLEIQSFIIYELFAQNVYISYVDKQYGDSKKAALKSNLEGWKCVYK